MNFNKLFGKVERGDIQNQQTLDEKPVGLSFIAQNDSNNGFVKRVSNVEYRIFDSNSIIIGRQTAIVYYQPERFVTTDGVLVLKPIKFKLDRYSGLFLSAILQKNLQAFSYSNTVSARKLSEITLTLPFHENNIAFSYMENYIKALEAERIETLEAERIETLEAYLTVTGLRDYHLTKNDEKVLDRFAKLSDTESRVEEWGTYDIIDIFDVKNTHNILSSWVTENSGYIPYLTAIQNNNSVSSYIDYDMAMIDEGNSIFIGGKTLVITYQELDYFSNDSHNLSLCLKDTTYRNKTVQLFLTTALYKSLKPKYNWGNSISRTKIQDDIFQLPTKNKQPDYTFMSDFIRAVEKLVIKDLVQWLDKEIVATKEVLADH